MSKKNRKKQRKLKFLIRENQAVTPVFATVLLLLISVSIFSILYTQVLSMQPPVSQPKVNLALTTNEHNFTVYHMGGSELSLDTIFRFDFNNNIIEKEARDLLSFEEQNNSFSIGDSAQYGNTSFIGNNVSLTVIDVESNYILLNAVSSVLDTSTPFVPPPGVPYVYIDSYEFELEYNGPDFYEVEISITAKTDSGSFVDGGCINGKWSGLCGQENESGYTNPIGFRLFVSHQFDSSLTGSVYFEVTNISYTGYTFYPEMHPIYELII